MAYRTDIKNILIIGAGLIGSSWTAFFLAKGFDVTVSDPDPDVEKKVRAYIEEFWPNLTKLGLSEGASPDRIRFAPTLEDGLKNADFVLEQGPEREDLKRRMFKQIDDALDTDVLIASSSSGIPMSVIAADCTRAPERCLIAHPFNPPHIIPLVELVGSPKTSKDAIDAADAFFSGLEKVCVRLKKEIPGHAANRIAASLFREVVSLVEQDVLSVEDVDKALTWGPGIRWGVMGQFLLYHLGGGRGGITHFFEQFGDGMQQTWAALSVPQLNDALRARITDGINDYVGKQTIEELEKQRDEVLIDLIHTHKRVGGIVAP